MQINYKLTSDEEPTDEQLHQLMSEVITEVKNKQDKSNKLFWEKLQQLAKDAKEKDLTDNSNNK